MEDQCVITRQITVAPGVFAPGHLGELTQIVPFEMVDQALAATGTTQARIRVLPARVVVYLLLAGCLFAELGYRQVWHKLTAGLGTLPARMPVRQRTWLRREMVHPPEPGAHRQRGVQPDPGRAGMGARGAEGVPGGGIGRHRRYLRRRAAG